LRDELEFERETKNTFISLLMSIHEKRRQLNENCLSISQPSRNSLSLKKKNRRSLVSLNADLSSTVRSQFFRKYTIILFKTLLSKAFDNNNSLQ
jgi:hypothetical protein